MTSLIWLSAWEPLRLLLCAALLLSISRAAWIAVTRLRTMSQLKPFDKILRSGSRATDSAATRARYVTSSSKPVTLPLIPIGTDKKNGRVRGGAA